MPKPDTTPTVYKANALIEAAYRLSVMEQRIVLAAITQVQHNEPVTDEIMYSVSVDDITRLCGTDSKSTYEEIQEAALRLKHRDVRLVQEPNGGKRYRRIRVTSWVQTVDYMEGEGRVELRFSKDMLPYLTRLTQQFTKYRLEHVAKMTSGYAVRLYELLVQWRESGEREVSVEWLRDAFLLENQYPEFRELRRSVIDPAVKQINEHSDLHVTCTRKKAGHRVTHLLFKFCPKKPKNSKLTTPRKRAGTGEHVNGVSKALIKKYARPGESWESAAERIRRDNLS